MTRPFIVHRSSFIVLLVLSCAKVPAPTQHAHHRLITLAPNITEIVFAVGCGGQIVGTDNFSDQPADAAHLPKVGGVEPDVEKIVSLKPDLVIASSSGVHPALRRALAAVHIPLLVIRTDRLSDIATAMITVGRATGCDPNRAVAAFNQSVENNRRWRTHAPRVLFAVWTDPLYIAGRKTFIDDLYEVSGAENAADVDGWPQYSLESFMAHPPDILIYPNRSVTPQAVRALLGRAHVAPMAVGVDENTFTRPGPRVSAAAEALNRIEDEWERSH